MTKFMAASRQVYELNHERVKLEAKVYEMEKQSSRRAEVRAKLKDEVKELKNLVEKLKADVVEKDTRLDHLQKEATSSAPFLERLEEQLLGSSRRPTSSLTSWTRTTLRGFEDFHMDAIEHFLEVDFSPIKLCIAVESFLL